jgi:hypothetical protein
LVNEASLDLAQLGIEGCVEAAAADLEHDTAGGSRGIREDLDILAASSPGD